MCTFKEFIWGLRHLVLLCFILACAAKVCGMYKIVEAYVSDLFQGDENGKELGCGALGFLLSFIFDLMLYAFYGLAYDKLRELKNRAEEGWWFKYGPTILRTSIHFLFSVALPLAAAGLGAKVHKPRYFAYASGYVALASVLLCLGMLDKDDYGIADSFTAVVLGLEISMHARHLYLIFPAVATMPAMRVLILPLVRELGNWARPTPPVVDDIEAQVGGQADDGVVEIFFEDAVEEFQDVVEEIEGGGDEEIQDAGAEVGGEGQATNVNHPPQVDEVQYPAAIRMVNHVCATYFARCCGCYFP